MIRELRANWGTKVKVDEATDYRIGASKVVYWERRRTVVEM
jgi:hypothetical protein